MIDCGQRSREDDRATLRMKRVGLVTQPPGL
jgi:hypothetical protein